MARLYADENFPLPVVEHLRRLNHDVLTLFEDGNANQRYPDEAVLADATKYRRALLTLNRRHFVHLHSLSAQHGGIVICSYDPNFAGQARRIDKMVREHSSLEGLLIRVKRTDS